MGGYTCGVKHGTGLAAAQPSERFGSAEGHQ